MIPIKLPLVRENKLDSLALNPYFLFLCFNACSSCSGVSKVRIVPSGIRGQPKGEWLNGIATFATPEQLEHALKQRNKKYGFKARLSGLFSRTKGNLIGIIISLD